MKYMSKFRPLFNFCFQIQRAKFCEAIWRTVTRSHIVDMDRIATLILIEIHRPHYLRGWGSAAGTEKPTAFKGVSGVVEYLDRTCFKSPEFI